MGNKLSYQTVDLTGKNVIVTGGNAGIGYVTAVELAKMGASVIIGERMSDRTQIV